MINNNAFLKKIFYAAVILLPVILFRVPAALLMQFSKIDEGIFAAAGNSILHAGVMYKNAVDTCGPVIPYIYAFIFFLFGKNNILAVHIALILLVIAIILLIYSIGTQVWGKRVGYSAALFFAIFSNFDHDHQFLVFYMEWAAVFFSITGVYFLLQYFLKNKYPFVFLSGISLGLAFLSKQIAAFNYLHALLFSFLFAYLFHKGKGSVKKAVILMISGFISAVAAFAGYFYINGALKDFWFWFWEYHNRFYVPALSVFDRVKLSFEHLITAKSSFFFLNPAISLLFILGLVFIIKRYLDLRKINKELFIEAYLFSWVLFSYGGIAYSGRGFSHYFIMLLPPLCLAGARTIYMKSKLKVFLLIIVVIQIALTLFNFHNRLYLWELVINKTEALAVPDSTGELVGYIKNNSGKDDKIFVWGCYPEIYGTADRLSSSRYINCNFLTGLIPWTNTGLDVDTSESIVPMGWEEFQKDMADNRPLFIIDTSVGGHRYYSKYPPGKFSVLENLLKERYHLEKEFFDTEGGLSFRLYRKNAP